MILAVSTGPGAVLLTNSPHHKKSLGLSRADSVPGLWWEACRKVHRDGQQYEELLACSTAGSDGLTFFFILTLFSFFKRQRARKCSMVCC